MANEFIARNGLTSLGNIVVSGSLTATGAITVSGSIASASFATNAATASSADNLLVRSTLTAQTLVVQTITSSVDFVTGSTRFGSTGSNTHQFTGSVSITGSLTGTTATFSGNMGIGGATLSSWGSGWTALETTGGSLSTNASSNLRLLQNNYFDGTNYIYITTAAATRFESSAGAFTFRIAPSGTAGTAATFSTALTIANTGAASFSGSVDIQNANKLSIYRADNARALQLYTTNDECVIDSWQASSEPLHIRSIGSGGRIQFFTSGSEKMRITADGNVGIGDPSPSRRLVVNSNIDGISADIAGSTYGIRFDNGGTFSSAMSTIHGVDSTLTGTYQPIMLNGSEVRLGTSATIQARITSAGYLRLTQGGIQFNGDTADANSLDDYEEGSWTPTILGSSSNPTLTGYSTQVGRYTKVGRLVTIHCALQPSATSVAGTGNLEFGGLPFTSANIVDVIATGVSNSNGNFSWGTGKTQLVFSVGVNTTKISVWALQNGVTEAGIPVNNFNNSNQYLLFSITYMAT